MTKLRAPVTFDSALARIAGVIGWDAMAREVERAERTVRDWGDPDVDVECPVPAAVKLDLAYQAAGGIGAPMFETFERLVGAASALRFADNAEIARHTIVVVKEGSEAEAALIAAQLPGATEADRAHAARQLEESIAAQEHVLARLVAPRPPPAPA